ncbi:hypothetical protein PhCBS80983_g01307 [Powellomyces hirtus]|uniref:Glutaredoxin domain-containing protein n=1 Tax=Powellomyces hirtus TaxID=109895 RepID=A0A507EDM4_9FUNG|nr:hypothetical protein PhCBS80983_g01307 [Powellomyces hirtus]
MAKPDNVVCEDGVCHIDFSKNKKAAASSSSQSDVSKQVEDAIAKHKVLIYSKTYCPYCDKAKALLKSKNVNYEIIELDTVKDGEKMHAHLKELSGQTTVPNIYINGKHIGGCSDLIELDQSGELDKLLQ